MSILGCLYIYCLKHFDLTLQLFTIIRWYYIDFIINDLESSSPRECHLYYICDGSVSTDIPIYFSVIWVDIMIETSSTVVVNTLTSCYVACVKSHKAWTDETIMQILIRAWVVTFGNK